MKNFRSMLIILCLVLCVGVLTSCFDDLDMGDNILESSNISDNNDFSDDEFEITDNESDIPWYDISSMDFGFTNRDENSSFDRNNAVQITFSDSSMKISGSGATAKATKITITEEGTYILSGKASDGMVTVDCGDEDKVQIVLDGVSITNKNGPAFYVKNADKVVITLAKESENTLEDGASYEYTDGSTNVDATIFSKADIAFNGGGKLTVRGNAKHGICSKDDLIFTSGRYHIVSKNVGLDGKDCVKIRGGVFNIDAGTDGIRSNNEEDMDRGYVYIEGGEYKIIAGNDGIQAQNVLKITDGIFSVSSGGGYTNASTKENGEFNDKWGFGGNDFGGRPGQMKPGFRQPTQRQTAYNNNNSNSTESAKALKAGGEVLLNCKVFDISSADDAIHSNGNIVITGGTYFIASGDDGIHADAALTISGGDIDITKSYEGLESSDIIIKGGNISVVATDDGINAAGGNDGSAMGNRPGMGGFSKSTGKIVIEGGYTVIDASGDGIDANGTISVSGGVTIVYGATNSGNGALDYDASATITGGTLIALGSIGMAQGITPLQSYGAISAKVSGITAGQTLALCDKDGNVVVSVKAKKKAEHIVFACNGIDKGQEYSLVSGAEIANADDNGYAEYTTLVGGNQIATLNMTSNTFDTSQGRFPMHDR